MIMVSCSRSFVSFYLTLFVQRLIERSWFAVLDTFILLAAFHEELSPGFVAMVTLLFAMKSFHWLTSDRVEYVSHSHT